MGASNNLIKTRLIHRQLANTGVVPEVDAVLVNIPHRHLHYRAAVGDHRNRWLDILVDTDEADGGDRWPRAA